MPTRSSATVTATSGMPTAIARISCRCPSRLRRRGYPCPSGSRASTAASAWAAARARPRAAQPASGQPAIANTGSASRITAVPASAGARRLGIGARRREDARRTRFTASAVDVDLVDDERPRAGCRRSRRSAGRCPTRRAPSRRGRRRASRGRWCRGATPTRWRESAASWGRRRPSGPEHTTVLVTVESARFQRISASSSHR